MENTYINIIKKPCLIGDITRFHLHHHHYVCMCMYVCICVCMYVFILCRSMKLWNAVHIMSSIGRKA